MIRLLSLENKEDFNRELARVGVDPKAWAIFQEKNQILQIKIEELSAAGANILKQTALTVGADCAIHREVISGRVKRSPAILFATPRQLETIINKLKHQPECASKLVPGLLILVQNLSNETKVLKIGGQLFELGKRSYLMGILNITPDSFYDGSKYLEPEKAIEQGLKLVAEGADILDIGAESTRPGANPVPSEEQLKRLLPVLKPLRKKVKVPISVDTTSAQVAEIVLNEGVNIINDISGFNFDKKMAETCARLKCYAILMHIKGKPRTMQRNPVYQDLMQEVISYLKNSVDRAVKAGMKREQLFIDPGIGFGKKLEHNLELLRRLGELRALGLPVVVGPSRKSFIGMILNLPVEERLEGTIAASVFAVLNGADIVRVHDIEPVKRALRIIDAIRIGKTA